MAATRVTEIQTGRFGSVGKDGLRNYKKVFRVEMDSMPDGPATAILAIPVHRYDPYVEANNAFFDLGALADEVTDSVPEDPENCLNWLVTVNYSADLWERIAKALNSGGRPTSGSISSASVPSSPHGGNPDPTSPDHPLNQPSKVSFGHVKGKRVLEEDPIELAAGNFKAIVNSAHQTFDPPYEVDETYRTLTIVRNELIPSQQTQLTWEQFFDTVNKYRFLGREARTVKCEYIDWSSERSQGFDYAVVTYEFSIRPLNGWKLRVLDQGTVEWDAVNFVAKQIRDRDGILITTPWPLKNGLRNDPPANPEYLEFNPYPEMDFDDLDLP